MKPTAPNPRPALKKNVKARLMYACRNDSELEGLLCFFTHEGSTGNPDDGYFILPATAEAYAEMVEQMAKVHRAELEGIKRVLELVNGYTSTLPQHTLHGWNGGAMTMAELREHLQAAAKAKALEPEKASKKQLAAIGLTTPAAQGRRAQR